VRFVFNRLPVFFENLPVFGRKTVGTVRFQTDCDNGKGQKTALAKIPVSTRSAMSVIRPSRAEAIVIDDRSACQARHDFLQQFKPLSAVIVPTLIVLGAFLAGTAYLNFKRAFWTAEAAPQEPRTVGIPGPMSDVLGNTIAKHLEYSGRTESIRSVVLQARIAGYVEAQVAPDGADVKEGDLLYKIDGRDLQAVLDQATARAQRDSASLAYARSNFSRGRELAKSGWFTKDNLDQREATMHQTEAALAMDKAAIRLAELNLRNAEIRAPFAGRIGHNQAPAGTLTNQAGTVLNTLVQLDPICVTFSVSETDLITIKNAQASGPVDVDVLLRGEPQPSHRGRLTFVDNVADPATGTITARATIRNPDLVVLPGRNARVHLEIRN
jgi:multidrug efflux system membrane fusion protein